MRRDGESDPKNGKSSYHALSVRIRLRFGRSFAARFRDESFVVLRGSHSPAVRMLSLGSDCELQSAFFLGGREAETDTFHRVVHFTEMAAASRAGPGPRQEPAAELVSRVGMRGLSSSAVTCCFPGCGLAGSWNPGTPVGDVGVPGGRLSPV